MASTPTCSWVPRSLPIGCTVVTTASAPRTTSAAKPGSPKSPTRSSTPSSAGAVPERRTTARTDAPRSTSSAHTCAPTNPLAPVTTTMGEVSSVMPSILAGARPASGRRYDRRVATDGPEDAPRDFVDGLLASWAAGRPDLDVSPVAVTTRLGRVRDHLEGESAALFGEYGLTAPTFATLATLARLGGGTAPVPEATIATELGLTPATIGGRVDRLVRDGIAARTEAEEVGLTPAGRDLVDAVVPAHLERQAQALSALTMEEQGALAELLRTLLASLEGRPG